VIGVHAELLGERAPATSFIGSAVAPDEVTVSAAMGLDVSGLRLLLSLTVSAPPGVQRDLVFRTAWCTVIPGFGSVVRRGDIDEMTAQ
jgi:hypothetical protein